MLRMDEVDVINDGMTTSAKSYQVVGFVLPAFSPRDNMMHAEIGIATAPRASILVPIDNLQANNTPGHSATSALELLFIDCKKPAGINVPAFYGAAFRIFHLIGNNKIIRSADCADNFNPVNFCDASAFVATKFGYSFTAIIIQKLFSTFNTFAHCAFLALIPFEIKTFSGAIFPRLIFAHSGFEKREGFSARLANSFFVGGRSFLAIPHASERTIGNGIRVFSSLYANITKCFIKNISALLTNEFYHFHKNILHWACRLFCLETADSNGGQVQLYHDIPQTSLTVSRQCNYTILREVYHR